jgi:shikimate 5-dehydrogenase
VEKAQAIADNLGEKRLTVVPLGAYSPGTASGAHLVVNTLSVPFRQEGGWLADFSAVAGALFYDLRYGGMPSDFTYYAGELKSPSMDGRGMLLYQGARAFRLFCGQEAPLEVMRESLTHS